jgi:hypothetical protein
LPRSLVVSVLPAYIIIIIIITIIIIIIITRHAQLKPRCCSVIKHAWRQQRRSMQVVRGLINYT